MRVECQPVQLQLPVGLPRTPGVHLSSVIRCIAMEGGILKPEWEEDSSLIEPDSQAWWAQLDSTAQTRIAMGLAWESWYIPTQLTEVIDHPGEILLDGIYMTPDGHELTTVLVNWRNRYKLKLHEIKLTYKSIKTVIGEQWQHWLEHPFDSQETPIGPFTSQWMWLAQAKGYCKGAGTNEVDFHVCFVCGDYSWPQRPLVARCRIEFTQEEIDDNWVLMTDYRDHRQAMELDDAS